MSDPVPEYHEFDNLSYWKSGLKKKDLLPRFKYILALDAIKNYNGRVDEYE